MTDPAQKLPLSEQEAANDNRRPKPRLALASEPAPPKGFTLEVVITEEAFLRLKELAETTSGGSLKKAVRKAMVNYDRMHQEVDVGGEFFLRKRGSNRVIEIRL